ncbi:extracellular solute-binding protein [Phyllobacterium sp. 0TCS1.6C]|uniref:extracellular solute-binding protein n=1 Tax=unclassified Phyllobacterium TaxID=2638441 RepID=UPI002265193F|nr:MULTISPECIES: extracellular solute-binding protein [unclassified Phyllobacterium]MCX8282063.1 extracellular solute-binding protein [Phyllobacterium sp. 0TCS1.6C]MCX8296245.1 extracellular solute-binding protein [Phyllobacterium sp. 0TCS1.6A]
MTKNGFSDLTRRSFLKSATATATLLAAPGILRAETKELVVGGAASHTKWVEEIVAPAFEKKYGARIIFEGTKSLVNLEKMQSNKAKPYLSVVQMDDPVMIMAVNENLLTPITPALAPNIAKLRQGTVHMDGMWANYVQPWAGIAYNKSVSGVDSWTKLWDPAFKGRVVIPSLQNTEGMWTLFMAAHLATGKPLAEAQYEIDAAFAKLEELKPNLLNVYAVLTQSFNLLEQNEIAMLAGQFSSYTIPRVTEGATIDLAAPKEGIFAMPSGICLVKDGPNPELAAAYVNEMLGAELQSILAESTYSLPANTEVKGVDIAPAGIEVFGPDWAFVSKNRANWIDRFDRMMAI